jgi:hypothetical protein
MDDQGADDDRGLGSLAEEATRLLGAMQDWVGRTFSAEAQDGHRRDCQWCPLCQCAAVLRGERPDLTDRVAEAGAALVVALRAVADAVSGTAPAAPSSAPQHRAPDQSSAPRVQRISLVHPADDGAEGA